MNLLQVCSSLEGLRAIEAASHLHSNTLPGYLSFQSCPDLHAQIPFQTEFPDTVHLAVCMYRYMMICFVACMCWGQTSSEAAEDLTSSTSVNEYREANLTARSTRKGSACIQSYLRGHYTECGRLQRLQALFCQHA